MAYGEDGSRLVQRLAAGIPQKVVVYGTSLTAGGPWVGQMRDWLTNTYSGSLLLVNSGMSGKNSKDGILNLDASVLAHRPDAVLIEFGMNDAFTNYADSSFNLSITQAQSNLETMIHRILTNRSDTEIILQTMNSVWNSTNLIPTSVSATMRPNLAAYYQMYRDVAAAHGLLLVDHEPVWRALQTNDTPAYHAYVYDGVHPTSNGTVAVTLPGLKRKLIGEVAWETNTNAGPVLVEADVCVYGDTAAAVIAAVQASRQGKRVVLVAPSTRLGGMTSGGLGWTDVGSASAIGGLSREFYRRVYWAYRENAAWTIESRSAYLGRSSLDPDETNRVMFTFEPKVAAAIMADMLAESRATAIHARLLRGGGVTMDGASIREFATDDGKHYVRAGVFIDASYEGDLLAEAGVPYTVGREANMNYGETISGIQVARASAHQLPAGVDPYVVPGNPASGLLPGVEAAIGGSDGTGDGRLQAYNYRMCLTDIASNRAPITQPAGYNEGDYTLLFRALSAGMAASFYTKSPMPNRKTDSNNSGGFSTDFIGGNYSISGGWNYAEASYAKRDEVTAAHRKYLQGFLWALQNSTNISAAIRTNTAWSVWGLPLDEFPETGGWPSQLYVREARRMLGAFVMTQHEINQTPGYEVSDPVGMGSYTMDSHHVQRYVTTGGVVRNEGDVQVGVARGAYGISYRSLVPPTNSVDNLLVPVCLSATHMALGSIRMEPVYMALGHAAGSAAVRALDDGVAVQAVDYGALRAQLLADGQILPGGSTNANGVVIDNSATNGVVLTGPWSASTSQIGYFGSNYIHDGNTNKGASSVRFTPELPAAGDYTVQIRWTAQGNRATNVPVDVVWPGASNTFFLNQQNNNGVWVTLLTTNFPAGTDAYVVVRNDGTTNYVIADAIQFTTLGEGVSIVAADADAYEAGVDPARLLVTRTAAGAPLTVHLSIGGTASAGTDYTALTTSVTIAVGETAAELVVYPLADALAEGDESVVVSVLSNDAYFAAAPTSAVVTIHDPAKDAWKHAHFSLAQLADPNLSGDQADPDLDGRANLAEFALGGNPGAPDPASTDPTARLVSSGGLKLRIEYGKAAAGLTYEAERSAGLLLNDWTTSGVSDEFYLPATARFAREIPVQPADAVQFLRLRIGE